MRVLMLAPGGSIHSKRHLRWLLESGCQVTFMDYTDPGPQDASHQAYRFMAYPRLRGQRILRRLFGSRMTGRMNLWLGTSWLRLARTIVKPDVVHVHWVDHRAYCAVKAGLRPLVMTGWGSDINRYFLPGADQQGRDLVGEALAGADVVIGQTPDMLGKFTLLAGCELRTEILTMSLDTRVFHPGYQEAGLELRRRLEIPPEATVLLSMRGMMPTYGHHLILEAFAQAWPRLKADAILVFGTFAASESYEAELRRRAEELGISQRLRWLAQLPFEQMPVAYALADLVLNFPAMDGFPATFMEAAACERPVITCRLPSYQGTFAEKYFYMVEPGNIVDLAEAIVRMADQDPAERAENLSEARRAAVQEYDESISARRLVGIYRALVDNAK